MKTNILDKITPKFIGNANRFDKKKKVIIIKNVYEVRICFEVDNISEIPKMYIDFIKKELEEFDHES